jgi:hypothetical protein
MGKKSRPEKRTLLGVWAIYWFIVLVMGFFAWFLCYVFYLHPVERIEPPEAFFMLGIVAGVCAMACLNTLVWVLTPVAKWAWGRIRHRPSSFLGLLGSQ